MGTHSMTADNIGPMVDRFYHDTTANQWAREAYVNAGQAGAGSVHFTTEWEALEALGVHRRAILDDGEGMSGENMPRFLNKIGGSGKAVGARTDNYGVGLKIGTLPWNHYGLVVVSRRDGETTLMWIHYDNGTYGAREFDISGEDEDPFYSETVPLHEFSSFPIDGVDWVKVFPDDYEHGTMIVLCGMTGEEDTILGDPHRSAEEGKFSLLDYFNYRFWDFPESITVTQSLYNDHRNKASWPTSRADWEHQYKHGSAQHRTFRGLQNRLAAAGTPSTKYPGRGIQAQGTVVVPSTGETVGAEIAWTLFTEEYNMPNDIRTPVRGVRFESHSGINEVYDVAHDGRDSILSGFMKIGSIRSRMAIIVTPLPGKSVDVHPNPGRTVLRWSNSVSASMSLPWWDWIAYWNANRPAEIDKAVDDYYASLKGKSGKPSDIDYERLGKRYLGALREVVKRVPSRSAKASPGTPTDESETRGKRKKPSVPKPGVKPKHKRTPPPTGPEGVVDRRVRSGIIQVDIADLAPDEPDYIAVQYNEADRRAVINRSSIAYRRCRDFITAKYEGQIVGTEHQMQEMRDAVVKQIDTAMQIHVALALTEIVNDARSMTDSGAADARRTVMDDAALSNVLRGIRAIEEIASGPIGARLKVLGKAAPPKATAA